jgi:antitoxin component YwqK of YwqJK toxin-antitoxin module
MDEKEFFDQFLWRLKTEKKKIIFVLLLGLCILLIVLWKTGRFSVATFRKEGLNKQYYKTGEVMSESYFRAGVRDGSYKEYYQDGKLKLEATFKNGKLDGIVKAYDEDGNLTMKEIYDKGEVTYQKTYQK